MNNEKLHRGAEDHDKLFNSRVDGAINDRLRQKYGPPEMTDRFGREWYRIKEGYHVHPDLFSKEGMVIEHAHAPESVYLAEDGDVFYFSDYGTVEDMFDRIENEINDSCDE